MHSAQMKNSRLLKYTGRILCSAVASDTDKLMFSQSDQASWKSTEPARLDRSRERQ